MAVTTSGKLSPKPYRPAQAERYGRAWKKLSVWYKRHNPLCAECMRQGCVTEAHDVDHIVPKRLGGTDKLTNLQSLCIHCHKQKTLKDAAP